MAALTASSWRIVMDKLIVTGGARLEGRVQISGSKNSVLPILAATLLTPEECVIHKVPDLTDVRFMLDILEHLGAEVSYENGTVRVKAENIHSEAPYDLVRTMRASICVLGPLLARCGKVTISLPGGCVIGDRPIDIHLKGLAAMGAEIVTEGGNVLAEAGKLVGTEVFLGGKQGSTVLGTDNVMMAATMAEGLTIIESSACEPEVQDLAHFLNKRGAKAPGGAPRRIEVEGVKELHGAEHTVIPDRIEAGTYLIAGLITGGDVVLENVDPAHMSNLLDRLKACGAIFETNCDSMRVTSHRRLSSLEG